MLSLYCVFYNRIMGHRVLVTFHFHVIRHTRKQHFNWTLCQVSWRAVIEGERVGWVKAAFGHLCILVSVSWCWAGTFLVQICVPGAPQSEPGSWLTHCPAPLPRLCQWCGSEEALPSKHSHMFTLSPWGRSREETSVCLYRPPGEVFLLPLVYISRVWNVLAVFFCSFSHVPMGRPRTGCGTPANAESVLGWAGKELGGSHVGWNRR